MNIDELITALANDIKSENFMLQVVFNRHITQIEMLKREGYTYKRMMFLLNEKIDTKIKDSHFSNLIYRAKKKITANEKTSLPLVKKEGLQKEEQKKSDVDIAPENKTTELVQSVEEWRLKTNVDIPARMALRLERNGIDTDKLNELNLTTTSKISKYLTQIEHKKIKE